VLRDAHGPERLHLSGAADGAWVAVAVSRVAPAGVAVCPLERLPLAVSVLARAERDVLLRLDEDAARLALLTLWTRKAAVLAAAGGGDPRDLVLTAPGDGPPRLLAHGTAPHLRHSCSIADIATDPAHAAAVAVLAPEPVTLTTLDGAALIAR
jgi:phosphopantetheinyl transferase